MNLVGIFHQLTRLSTQLEPRIPSGLPTTGSGGLREISFVRLRTAISDFGQKPYSRESSYEDIPL
jgi:hypothetical protein